MPFPAKRVAVVGAGISGVCTAAHLLKLGLEVVVFERSEIAGGVWHFDPRAPVEPAYPSENPATGDYVTTEARTCSTPPPEEGYSSDIEIAHAPPGPCYAGLKNNVSTPLMRTSLLGWPEGTEDFVNQVHLEKYIQSISHHHSVHKVTEYSTRVEDIKESDSNWLIRTIALTKSGTKATKYAFCQRWWTFDAVVIASGHYNAPRVPDMPGLAEWKTYFPHRISHSKGYRLAEPYRNKNVLLVGAGVSSCDIARELTSVGANVMQSSRGGLLDLPTKLLPDGAARIGQILSFDLDRSSSIPFTQLQHDDPIPGFVTAYSHPPSLDANGDTVDSPSLSNPKKVVREIHYVILCTGYMISYPFLNQYHSTESSLSEPSSSSSDSSLSGSDQSDLRPDVLTTASGTTVHNLYLDTFFISNPSLAFVGTPYHIATFSLFDFQGQAVARVFAGVAELPSTEDMRTSYEGQVRAKGLGRDFHSLRAEGDEERFVRELVEWMNKDMARLKVGNYVPQMLGHTEEWKMADRERRVKLKWLRETAGRGRRRTDLNLDLVQQATSTI